MAAGIEVHPIGTPIAFGSETNLIDGIRGRITAICIRGSRVTYEATWWNDRSRCEAWLTPDEFDVVGESKPTRIGFKNGH